MVSHSGLGISQSLICSRDFEENMTLLMLNLLPTIIAPKAYKGRAAIKAAFTKYYDNNYELTGSTLIRSHLTCAQKWGFTADDIANFEISTLFLATTNSVPTSFWQLSYILACPSLHRQIQTEVESIVTREKGQDGTEEAVMNITLFQSHCPLLVATFHETLRLIDAATSVRAVVEPTTLTSSTSSSSFSLKSPSVIQLPSGITHSSPSIWGPDASSFNPERFLPEAKNRLNKKTRRKQSQGYFPFGGGKHLCPGRHFAMMEILALVAGIIVGFEVQGMDSVPERAFQKLGTAVRKPVADVEVGVKRREGWEGVNWRFEGGGRVDFRALGTDSDGE
jgi:cytochrome P450